MPQVMLEGDDRRERRNIRRAAQNLRAVDDVALHDGELFVGQLVRLVQDFGRRLHLADVVHERGEAELAQQRTVDAQAARLGHREDRHVHHVRERVVVVVLQRRQRHQRRAVLHDRLREPVDHRLRRRRIGLRVGARAFPHHAGHRHRLGVHLADRRRVGAFLGHGFFERHAADADIRRLELRRGFLQRVARERLLELPELAGKGLQLVERDRPLNRDALDAERAEPANQLAHRRAGLGHRQIADDQLLAEHADDDRRVVLVQRAKRFGEPLEVARDDRMVGAYSWMPRSDAPKRRSRSSDS